MFFCAELTKIIPNYQQILPLIYSSDDRKPMSTQGHSLNKVYSTRAPSVIHQVSSLWL